MHTLFIIFLKGLESLNELLNLNKIVTLKYVDESIHVYTDTRIMAYKQRL